MFGYKAKVLSLTLYKQTILLTLMLGVLSRETKYLWDNLWEIYLDVEYHYWATQLHKTQ